MSREEYGAEPEDCEGARGTTVRIADLCDAAIGLLETIEPETRFQHRKVADAIAATEAVATDDRNQHGLTETEAKAKLEDSMTESTTTDTGDTEPAHNEDDHDWKLATITLNGPGPKLLIKTEDDTHAVNTVRFNDFRLSLDGRAEVEYTELEIAEEDYPTKRVADFRDPNNGEVADGE